MRVADIAVRVEITGTEQYFAVGIDNCNLKKDVAFGDQAGWDAVAIRLDF